MKHLLLSMFILFLTFGTANADYTFVVPQKPGAGTSQWAQIVTKELEKHLGEKIVIRHIPGGRDRIGFEKFHEELRFDDKTVMVSHGGNAIGFLTEPVGYDYGEYDSVAIMNFNIAVAHRAGLDWRNGDKVSFAAGSGMVPEALAMALLLCGPEAPACWEERVVWVRGMSNSERRLAFRRGELMGTRENVAAYKKHVNPVVESGDATHWFNHGMLNPATGDFGEDPNLTFPHMEKLYEELWGEKPSGDFYDAYKLAKAWRDSVQKALWVNKGNPNRAKLVQAVKDMLNDPESVANLHKKMGSYPWRVGDEGNDFMNVLYKMISSGALKTLVDFEKETLGLDAVYNEKRVHKD